MNFIVTGVVADPPVTTNFPFTTMLSFASLKEFGAFTNWDDWVSTYGGGQMYLMLPEKCNRSAVRTAAVGISTKKYRDPKDAEKLEIRFAAP